MIYLISRVWLLKISLYYPLNRPLKLRKSFEPLRPSIVLLPTKTVVVNAFSLNEDTPYWYMFDELKKELVIMGLVSSLS